MTLLYQRQTKRLKLPFHFQFSNACMLKCKGIIKCLTYQKRFSDTPSAIYCNKLRIFRFISLSDFT